MTYFVTGATGFIGAQLTPYLAARGHTVHALIRDRWRAKELAALEGVHLFPGDVLDGESLRRAMEGCVGVFHLAGYARPWHKDPRIFYRINVEGAANVFEAARRAGVERVVFTSTAGVINPSSGRPSDEATPRTIPLSTHYEKSKAEAEQVARSFNANGLEVVTVNPSRVYGPGLLSDSNGVTRMVKLFVEGKFRFLPGNGKSIGNYVFINDVVAGHFLAMQKGKAGERYILGGDNVSFLEFFEILKRVSGKNHRLFKLPLPLLRLAAHAMQQWAGLTGTPPLITPPFVKKYMFDWNLSSQKAQSALGYQPTPLPEGLEKTVSWLGKK